MSGTSKSRTGTHVVELVSIGLGSDMHLDRILVVQDNTFTLDLSDVYIRESSLSLAEPSPSASSAKFHAKEQ